jgi:hypothetical protein
MSQLKSCDRLAMNQKLDKKTLLFFPLGYKRKASTCYTMRRGKKRNDKVAKRIVLGQETKKHYRRLKQTVITYHIWCRKEYKYQKVPTFLMLMDHLFLGLSQEAARDQPLS